MRLRLVVSGVVQGVGFRPFVRRAALAHGLSGWIQNGRDGVQLEVQGSSPEVRAFTAVLERESPASISAIREEQISDHEESGFEIKQSQVGANACAALPPDLATCDACWSEVWEPAGRRHRYPFTNCASCGPRYSIAVTLPYDRERTSMAQFELCSDCAGEYAALDDRRHHAQPIACPRCGPALRWLDLAALDSIRGADALLAASRALCSGAIVALRGVGGFQLLCDATAPEVVARLRQRKRRPHKPFGVLFCDAGQLFEHAWLDSDDLRLLRSPAAPLVLLPRRASSSLAAEVCCESPEVGALLPYSPLHGLIAREVGRPLVCTSGNRAGEPICIETGAALERLGDIADGFLTHDRPIQRPLDDSVVQRSPRGPLLIRRARGYVPLPVARLDSERCILALGAHLKNAPSLLQRGSLLLAQHVGDLDAAEARAELERCVNDFCGFHRAQPELIACDLHPDYASTRIAEQLADSWQLPLQRVQHHHAHIAACMAEHGLDDTVLGLAWDGTGLGSDGQIWGCEALVCRGATFERRASLASFPLWGGDRAARDPRRAAFGLLSAHLPEAAASRGAAWFGADLDLALRLLERGINAPACSSLGRLFDAVAALLGRAEPQTFEGQAAQLLESWASCSSADGAYPLPLAAPAGGLLRAELRPLLEALCVDQAAGVGRERIARRFHEGLIDLGLALAELCGVERVALAGGCFQNRLLREGLRARLERRGFRVYVAGAVPLNDGGISVGQAFVAALLPVSSPPRPAQSRC